MWDENFLKDRRTVPALLLAAALYGGLYVLARGADLIGTHPPPSIAALPAPAAKLEINGKIFYTAYPPMRYVFFPALWVESFLPRANRADN